MRIVTGLAMCFMATLLVAAPKNTAWRGMVTQADVQLIDEVDQIMHTTLGLYQNQALASDEVEPYLAAIKFAEAEPQLIKNKELIGRWQCRSTQISARFLGRYPYFNCQIKQTAKGLWFQKTTGSQRVSGYLHQGQGQQKVFIGGATVNDDPLRSYDLNQPDNIPAHQNHNAVGVLRKISANQMILIQPNKDKAGYELYELIRKK
ncbi:DUF4893 domain-containing protein [Neisseriaceae bacterium CLB008]